MDIYIAGPVVATHDVKFYVDNVYKHTRTLGVGSGYSEVNIYMPCEHKVPNAWGIPEEMWGQCVFTMDVLALDKCDQVVVCDFGKKSTALGTAWEAGYAFAKNKQILVITMPRVKESSLMMHGCASNIIGYNDFIKETDFYKVFKCRGLDDYKKKKLT